MAPARKFRFILILVSVLLFLHIADGERTEKKIYIKLSAKNPCIRQFNATHQLGCASNFDGNVGTIHYMRTNADYEYVLDKGQHSPYMVVIDGKDFITENVHRLLDTSRVNGMLVINVVNETDPIVPEKGMSMSETCPQDRYGLYKDNPDYGACKKKVWNPPGSGLAFRDLGMPVFLISEQEDADNLIHSCFYRFNWVDNQTHTSPPLCAAEMKIIMSGAVSTETCMRRSSKTVLTFSANVVYCDPMGGSNVITTLKATPQNETREPRSVIMVTAKLDTTSLFQYEYHASDTTVSGLVTMLVTAQALWKVKVDMLSHANVKDIMFAFFQGETYDYIGSSRVAYDMAKGLFPQDYSDGNFHLHNVTLSHLAQIMELNQVGNRPIFVHTDPLANASVANQMAEMIAELSDLGRNASTDVEPADRALPLPPASSQRFLMEDKDIPALVLTDHKDSYSNIYYNSMFDMGSLIGVHYPANLDKKDRYDYVTEQAHRIANLSTTLARYLYKSAVGHQPAESVEEILTGDPKTATNLLYCFLVSQDCEIFKEVLDADDAESLSSQTQPFDFYPGVSGNLNQVTGLVYRLMAYFTGENLDVPSNECKQVGNDQRFSYTWMLGANQTGQCYKSTVQYTTAESPAFSIDGYDWHSGQYSTWTESRWTSDPFHVRLFLKPSKQFEVTNLCVGCAILALSLLMARFASKSAGAIFPNGSAAAAAAAADANNVHQPKPETNDLPATRDAGNNTSTAPALSSPQE